MSIRELKPFFSHSQPVSHFKCNAQRRLRVLRIVPFRGQALFKSFLRLLPSFVLFGINKLPHIGPLPFQIRQLGFIQLLI